MNNFELEKIVNKYLNSNSFEDDIPNGLQIEGCKTIKNIVTGVTACEKLIDEAIKLKADAIMVHHGYFWKKEPSIIQGIKKIRLKKILSNNINLYSWHLPIDLHPEIGNNNCIAKKLGINILGKLNNLVLWGQLKKSFTIKELKYLIKKKFNRIPFVYSSHLANKKIKNIAWCSGKGQQFVDEIYKLNKIDAFLTGEISEQTIHSVQENKIHFFCAGHHATEVFGIFNLGQWLIKQYNFNVNFVNIHNPI